jgi:Lipid A 3-O-deacylase (PagL)
MCADLCGGGSRKHVLVGKLVMALLGAVPATVTAQPRLLRGSALQWQVAVSDAVSTRTASHNEFIDGDFSTIAVQAAKPLLRWRGATFSWLVEIQPVIRVLSGAPPERVPTLASDPAEAGNPERLARYALRRSVGVGIAPFGAEALMPVASHTQFIVNVTSGGAWFSQVVPYGKATQANFTVAPGVALQQDVGTQSALAVGYALHHLSNASMGGANPGMNSHLLFLRWTRKR